MSYDSDMMYSLICRLSELNNSLKGLRNLSQSLESLKELSVDLKAFTDLTERQMFRQDWNEAVEYFKAKHSGSLPSDDIIIRRIYENRRIEEERFEKVLKY
jgi:biopolymer transport protein ExbB/TolQ